MIDDLVEDLKLEEGWRPQPYRDHLGFLTIGYGFLIDPEKSVALPRVVGEHWLLYEAAKKVDQLEKLWEPFKHQPEEVQRALGNMCYNLGVGGVLKFKHMLAALEEGDRETAAEEALDSKWAKQVPMRAKRVTDLIRGSNED